MMYQTGDRVVYGIHGVCEIVGTEDKTVDRKKVSYFVLQPLAQQEARFYIPVHNEAALAKLRAVLTAEDINTLLHSDQVRDNTWIADENQRKLRYRSLINSGDRTSLLCMVRTIYLHKQAQEAIGRRLHLCDENFLRDAQKLLESEFSLVLNIPQNEVGSYIRSALSDEK